MILIDCYQKPISESYKVETLEEANAIADAWIKSGGSHVTIVNINNNDISVSQKRQDIVIELQEIKTRTDFFAELVATEVSKTIELSDSKLIEAKITADLKSSKK